MVEERLPPGEEVRPTCSWHGPNGVRWPAQYAEWAADHGEQPYVGADAGSGEPAITWPADGSVLFVDPRIPAEHRGIGLRATAPGGAVEAVWAVDDVVVSRVGPPFHTTWPDPSAGSHRITVVIDGEEAGSVNVEVR